MVPVGTMAALATILPLGELIVEGDGVAVPVGHEVKYPSGPVGSTVMFNEYAWAVPGTPQELCGIGKTRVDPCARDGGPKDPLKPKPVRVSAIRQGIRG